MTLRSRAELRRSWLAYAGVMSDPLAGDIDREEGVRMWAPPTDAEFESAGDGATLAVLCEVRGGSLPDVPPWLDELAGMSEVARWCIAALIEQAVDGVVVDPLCVLRQRFRQTFPKVEPDLVEALRELRRLRLIRGNGGAVVVWRTG